MKSNPVLVFGHRNPDTDAICSALAYADYLRQTTQPEAIAACCGPLNQRTEFVLKHAKLDPPRIVMDVRPEVEDVCQRDVISATDSEVFFEVYSRLKKHRVRSMPVLDAQGGLIGILSLLGLMELVFQDGDEEFGTRRVTTSPSKICQVVNGEFQHSVDPETPSGMLVMVGAMSAHGFTERLHRFPAEQLLVVCGDRPTIQLPALERGVRGLVVTGGYELSPGLLALAQARNVTVIKSPLDTATTTIRIKSARSILSAVEKDFVSLSAKTTVAAARQEVERSHQSIFPVLNDSGLLIGIVSRNDLVAPPKPRLVLVDHNELTQAVDGADEAEIIEVLDHHRLGGGLKSSQPIRFVNEPVGSTCTLVARMYRTAGIKPTPGIALCMASGIIADTLNLRSPTATEVDRDILQWLRGHVELDLEQYAKEFFAVGSALRSSSPTQVVREDCKEFEENGFRFSISQIEEIGFDLFWSRTDELHEALDQLSRNRRLDFSALLITDIATNSSLLLMSQEPPGWEAINYPRVGKRLYKLDNVVSRKKQLLPLIATLLESAKVERR